MTGLIILAAGESSRLGFPKQTLLYKGKTLLEIAIEAGIKSKCSQVTVVLGANAEKITVGQENIQVVHNDHWAEGMASSITAGITALDTSVNSVIVMLCDQPFVNRALIDSLIYKQQETGKPIIACTYQDTLGVPALFHKHIFAELLTLTGQEGAKKIIQAHPEEVATVLFEKGAIDIDTLSDYEALINNS